MCSDQAFDHSLGVVATAVVDQHQLAMQSALCEDAENTPRELRKVQLFVETRSDDTQLGLFVH